MQPMKDDGSERPMSKSAIDGEPLPDTPAPVVRSKRTEFSRTLIAKSILSNWSYLTLNVSIAFWMTPFVVRHLGDSSYGIWALVLQLTGYMGVVDVGLRSALVRFVARFQTLGDDEGLNRLLNSTITLYLLMVPLCFVAAILMAAFGLPHMHIPIGMISVAKLTVFIAAGCIVCDFVFATCHACLAGLSRWDLTNSVWISVLLVRTALIVFFLESGFGLLTIAMIQFGVTLMGYLAEAVIVRRLLPAFRFKWQPPEIAHMRPIMQHSWYSFLLSIATKLNYQVDSIVIAFFLPIGQVTFYIIGLRLVEYLRELLNSTTMIFAPLVSSFDAVGETHRVAATLIRGTKYSLFVGFLGAGTLLALGSTFIRLWMGPRFEAPSGAVLVILTIGVLASCTQFASSHVLYGLGKHRLNVSWTLIESVLNLGFSVVLVRRYGILGVAAGTTIANIMVRGWLFPSSFLRVLNVPWRAYLQHGIAPAVAPALSFLAGTELYKYFCPIQNYRGLMLAAISGLLFFVICLWLCGLDHQDREMIRMKSRQFSVWARSFCSIAW
jgi:O-antigen/teichoic acid export membrane protein